MAAVACRACGSTEIPRPWGSKEGYTLVECPTCGLVRVDPLPESTTAVYASPDYFSGATQGFGYVDYDADKEPMREVFERYLEHAERLCPSKGRLLDVGAATGFFVALAKGRGWEAEGVELSDYAAEKGRSRGLSIQTGTLLDLPRDAAPYDALTLFDVIEHVRDPRAELSRAAELMRTGGVILITTPDAGSLFAKVFGARWHLVVPPEHLFYFTKKSMRTLLESLGFTVHGITRPGKRFTLQYFFATVARWCPLFPLPHIARFCATHPRVGDWSIPFNTYDNLFVVAQKRA